MNFEIVTALECDTVHSVLELFCMCVVVSGFRWRVIGWQRALFTLVHIVISKNFEQSLHQTLSKTRTFISGLFECTENDENYENGNKWVMRLK